MLKPVTTDIEALKILDERLRWLAAWTIHHANHVRPSPDGLKVGGHQASCASMTAIMAALYFHALSRGSTPRRTPARQLDLILAYRADKALLKNP